MSPAALLAPQAPALSRPRWAVGEIVHLSSVPARYHDALGPISWPSPEDGDLLVPDWVAGVCGLSRHGRSVLLRAWLEWCAAGNEDAAYRSALLQNIARLLPPEAALRAIHQMVRGG